MFGFLVRRIINLIPTVLGASVLIFFLIQAAPGDFLATKALSATDNGEIIQNLRENFGLDKDPITQYFIWMGNLLQGDFGISFAYRAPVLDIIMPRIINSLYLVVLGLVILYVVAIPAGVYSAVRQYSLGDSVISTVSYFFLGIPSFFFALIAIYLILHLNYATGWEIPLAGMTSNGFRNFSTWEKFLDVASHLIIPAVILALQDIAGFSRYLRAQMLEYLDADFIRTARSKGVRERSVVYKHALRLAIVPIIATIGAILPALLAGAGFVEVVFSYPGITPLFLTAIFQQDLYVLSGFLIMTTVLLVIGNVLSDLLLAAVDPRIRYA